MVGPEEEGQIGTIHKIPVHMVEGVGRPQIVIKVDEVCRQLISQLCSG